MDPANKLDVDLRAGIKGAIRIRQSTFWDLCLDVNASPCGFRVHFCGKNEFRYVGGEFHGGGIFASHPLLRNVTEPSRHVYLSRPVEDAQRMLVELRAVVEQWSDGWRVPEEYLNEQAWPEDVASAGYGVLLSGPQSLADRCVDALERFGCDLSILAGHDSPSESYQAMILGRSFVIARSFTVEMTDNG